MSYNGSGTFQINTAGQPVVAGTVISSTAFNALTADLATGLSTAITKDGQTTTTARIPFAAGISSTLTTDSSSVSTGSIITAGGVGIVKNLYVGANTNIAGTLGVTGVATFSAAPIYSSLTASSAVATDASKALVSVTNTGTGNNVLATSPTLVTPVLGAASATSITVAAGTVSDPAITTTGDTNTGIFFPAADTIAFSEGGAEAMRIDSSGQLGIGTTSPSSVLNVKSSAPVFRLETTGAVTSSGTASYAIKDSSGNDVFTNGFLGLANCYQFATTFANGFIRFLTGSQVEAMRIDSSGSLLINGTTQPVNTYKQVISFSGGSGGVGGGLLFNDGDSGNVYPAVYFRKDGAQRGNINVSTSGTTYNTVSDYRLKEDVIPMVGALAKVSALKPVTYKWKESGLESQGFIAHELAEVCPDAVTGAKDAVDVDGNPQYQGIDTSFLVATLTAAIQEQQALITALTAQITAQQASLDSLTARITALEAK
jgi:hypothetical protein